MSTSINSRPFSHMTVYHMIPRDSKHHVIYYSLRLAHNCKPCKPCKKSSGDPFLPFIILPFHHPQLPDSDSYSLFFTSPITFSIDSHLTDFHGLPVHRKSVIIWGIWGIFASQYALGCTAQYLVHSYSPGCTRRGPGNSRNLCFNFPSL